MLTLQHDSHLALVLDGIPFRIVSEGMISSSFLRETGANVTNPGWFSSPE